MADELSERIYFLVRHIPRGLVTTYGQLGAMVGITDARTIGEVMNASPAEVPWQRVINARGQVSLQGGTGSRQRRLLEEEEVTFDGQDRVDFARVGWVPEPAWLNAHNYKIPPSLVKEKKPPDGEQMNLF